MSELEQRRGNALQPQQIYEAFVGDELTWAHQQGATDTGAFCRIVRHFNIGRYIETFVDPERILEEAGKPGFVAVIGITERMPKNDQPGFNKVCHALLITPNAAHFDVWCPRFDGTAQEFSVPWATWYQWMIKGFVISD